ncbi:MAG: hypothetical protein MUC98_16265 [Desulfobacterota bacterium]|jgi:hypothetical protein|nr:hypothetical protein [Thermodesulfobacteriota bacterium]
MRKEAGLLATGLAPVGSVWATRGAIAGEDFREEIMGQARDLGKMLVWSWKQMAVLPEVEEIRKSFQERKRELMPYRRDDWPYEYEFWKKHRGLKC